MKGIATIDISEIGDLLARRRIGEEMLEALREVGFFTITGAGVDKACIDEAHVASRRFFALSVWQKRSILVNLQQRGWLAEGMCRLQGGETYDAKEIFFWGYSHAEANLWPSEHAPYLRSAVWRYFEAMLALGRDLMSALALGFGLEADFFARFYGSPHARGQLVYYPPLAVRDSVENRYSAAPHTDFGVLTILWQDDSGGLEARRRSGEWVSVPPLADSFVCNVGDLLERWSNGRLTSSMHRVVNPRGEARYSMPIFFDADSNAVIDARDWGIGEAELLYPPIACGEYIAAKNRLNFTHYGAIIDNQA